MFKRFIFAFALFQFCSFLAFAKSDSLLPFSEKINELVYYSADFINANLVEESAELKGNVKIIFNNYEVSAKNAILFKSENRVKLYGDVRIENQDSFIQAEEAELNYKTQKGVLKNVRITSGQLLLEAETLDKKSDTIYVAEKAKFTTCTTCPAAWRVKGRKIETNIEKYIDIRGGRLQILNQTLLPLPRLVLPINTRRKTGLIPPSFGNTTGTTGTEFAQPFFWVIDPHQDLTITPKIYSEIGDGFKSFDVNGGKLHLEYRRWLSNKSWFNANTAYMYDATYRDINGNTEATNRWYFNFKNYFELPNDYIQKSEITLVREREYLNDFFNEVYGRAEPALRNSFSLTKFKKNKFSSLEIVHHSNLLVEDPFDTNNSSIQKMPDIRYSLSETPFWKDRLLTQFDMHYTNFFRNGRPFDDIIDNPSDPLAPKLALNTRGDGQFDADQDLIRAGHRLRLNASVSAPFKIGQVFSLVPKLSYRDAYYNFNLENSSINERGASNFSNFAFSRYFEISNSIRTEFSKVFKNKYKHKIIPELVLRLGSNVDQSDNVFFDSQGSLPYHRQYQPVTDSDFFSFRHGVQFDYNDRFFRAEVAEFKLTNLIIQKKQQDKVNYYSQPFFFNLTQSYDFRNARLSDTPDPWSNLDGTLKLKTKHFTNLTQASHFYRANQTNISTRNTFTYRSGRFLTLGYSDFFTVDEQGQITDNRTQNINFGLGWEFPSVKFSGRIAYSLLTSDHLGWETHFLYTPRGNCWGLKLDLFEIANNTDRGLGYSASFYFNFGPDSSLKKSLLNI